MKTSIAATKNTKAHNQVVAGAEANERRNDPSRPTVTVSERTDPAARDRRQRQGTGRRPCRNGDPMREPVRIEARRFGHLR